MQTHLKGFGLENFRVFKDYTWFDFAPITILTGPNSSGKSSLNKALLLLKDNFEKGNLPPYYTFLRDNSGQSSPTDLDILQLKKGHIDSVHNEYIADYKPSTLRFNDKAHGLNSAETSITRNSDSTNISFYLQYEVYPDSWTQNAEDLLSLMSNPEDDISKVYNEEIEAAKQRNLELLREIEESKNRNKNIGSIQKSNWIKRKRKDVKYLLEYKYKNKILSTLNCLHIATLDNNDILIVTDKYVYFDPFLFDFFTDIDDKKIYKNINKFEKKIYTNHRPSLEDWFKANGIDADINQKLVELIYDKLDITFSNERFEVNSIKSSLNLINTLSVNRFVQKRAYGQDDDSEFKHTLKSITDAKIEGLKFDDFFDRCAKIFGIVGKIDVNYDQEQEIYFPNIDGFSILNYGYGYSLIITIIFKVAEIAAKNYLDSDGLAYDIMESPSIMIVEEPESNLHPKLQSLLADFLVEAAEIFQIQFIIETHSEYLIRKLQYLTATKKVKPIDSVIYYFHEPDKVPIGEKQVKKIQILEDGSLSDEFGTGFFDEAANWELELLRLKNNKNRQN
jgi:AAA15 family ATPase/GTPase